jgi:hypothetical protein
MFFFLIGIFINSSILAYGIENKDYNVSGNIVNLGYIAKDGDWIFYSNIADGSKLYKGKIDGTQETKLSDDIPNYINVSGDWIYFSNVSDGFKLYKVKKDGSERGKLNDESSFWPQVIDDTIVYARRDQAGQKLYKITIEGKNKTRISKDLVYGFVLTKDWIYYSNEEDKHKIYKVGLNGEGRQKLNEDESLNLLVSGNSIYYQNLSDNKKIYKIDIDGKNRTKLNDDSSDYSNIAQDYIYYSNLSDGYKLYKVKVDGTGKAKVNDEGAGVINIVNENIYYMKASKGANGQGELDPSNLIRIKTDGTSREVVKMLSVAEVGKQEEKKLTPSTIALVLLVIGVPFCLEVWKMISLYRINKFVKSISGELTDEDVERFINIIRTSRLIKRSDNYKLLATCIQEIKSSSKVNEELKLKSVDVLEKRGIRLNV